VRVVVDRVNRRLPIAGQSPTEDRLLAMIAALASEIAVLRERNDTLERLIVAAGVIEPEAIERFVPDEGQAEARNAARRRLIDKVFGPLRDALAAKEPRP
jgi:hypothetical protein